jgi:hypothetical protein
MLALAALAPMRARADDHPLPNARLEFSGWLGGVGIGYESLDGILVLDDRTYPVSIVGMTALEAGLAYVDGSAEIWGLHDPRELQGRYRAFAFSATVGGGGHVTLLQNRPGVYIEMTSCTYGLGLTVGPSAMRIFVHGVEQR